MSIKEKRKEHPPGPLFCLNPELKSAVLRLFCCFFQTKMKNIDEGEEEVLPGVKRIILVLSGTTVVE
jgi:hypothetical protein